jgi:hypothetical protein
LGFEEINEFEAKFAMLQKTTIVWIILSRNKMQRIEPQIGDSNCYAFEK